MLKYCALFSLCAGVGLAGDFLSGQAARAVIGQTTFTSQSSGASNTLMGGVGGLAFANNTLFVADSNRMGMTPLNNRVLMFTNMSNMLPQINASIGPNTGRCPVCVGQASVVIGQPDFTSTNYATSVNGMRLPVGVATDGRMLAVADTANNRVLLWKTIPTQNGQPADIVLGQPDFNTVGPVVVSASTFRAPQGVWLQNGKLYVADTQNNRIMIWNSIPTKNNQAADLVLGQANFTTVPNLDLTKSDLTAAPNTMLNPTSVTSDGTHLYVADLGFNRVLIWNSIPVQTQQSADVVVGQKDFVTAIPNDNTDLCVTNAVDSSGNPIIPAVCGNVLNFPRFALSDGKRLYVADTGNDRVLVFNTIPTTNGAHADITLGQPDEYGNDLVTSVTDLFTPNLYQSASNATPSPAALAWDGQNLYVSDPSNYRVLVFTPAASNVPNNGVVNAASQAIYAQGAVTFSGTITAGNVVLVQINSANYTYNVVSTDTLDTVSQAVAAVINSSNSGAGDPNVLAIPQPGFESMQLIARLPGPNGNNITLAASAGTGITTTTSNGVTTTTTTGTATITATASGTTLSGGGSAATLAPGAIVSVMGENLADTIAQVDPNAQQWPLDLGGVQVYQDGIRLPIQYVSPGQINVQVPFETLDTNSSSLYVRTTHADGSVTVTTAVGLPMAQQNPGIFAASGPEPRVAMAYHGSSYATGLVSVDGTVTANDTVTILIEDRGYTYTVQATDTLATIRDSLISLINAAGDEKVIAYPASAFTRVVLQAKVAGPEGNAITIAASSAGSTVNGVAGSATEVMTATAPTLCCANVGGAPITADNPAVPGEMIIVYATGLGVVGPGPAHDAIQDGIAYNGPANNDPYSSVSSLCGGSTANVISAGLKVGAISMYEVILQLNQSLATNPQTQLTISQDIYTSNIVTLPVTAIVPSTTSTSSVRVSKK